MPRKDIFLKLLLVITSLTVSVLFTEALLRFLKPYSALRSGSELPWMRNSAIDPRQIFTIDPKFGFRPILGSALYNTYGTKVNTYSIEKRAGVKRLLFIGDSVTQRGTIIEALKHIVGEENFEYWNAGVESFNTVQEVNFYKEYNHMINPDHVILTFHLNDFATTPISFYDRDRLVVYAPNVRLNNINPWLYQHSYVYRLLLGLTVARKDAGKQALSQEVRESLMEMKSILASKGVEFTVLIFPYLKPYASWRQDEKESRREIVNILEDMEISYHDLFDASQEAIDNGINIRQEENDTWHPSEDVSHVFAEFIYGKQIF